MDANKRLDSAELQAIRERAERATAGPYDEEWRVISGTDGLYEVSNMGNVRSLLKPGNRRNKVGNPRNLKLRKDKRGYCSVSLPLGDNGKYVTKLVHRLVAETFIGALPEGKETAHLNGNSSDNSVSNLAYVTHIENESHKAKHGTSPKGERNGQAKLLGWQVEIAKYLASKGIPQVKIAEMFGWHRNSISEVVNGTRWSHIQPYQDVPRLIAEVERLRADQERLIAELKKADAYSEELQSRYIAETFTENLDRITAELEALGNE